MNAPRRQTWVAAALLVGVVYFVIGRVFTLPVEPVRLWRLASWAISGAVFGVHIAYEHARVRSAPRAGAMHVAAAVALGAFLLALVALVRVLAGAAPFRVNWVVALIAWPALTAAPAFLVALVVATVLARRTPAAPPGDPIVR